MKKFWIIFSVSLAMVFWGITFVIFKYANESFDPIAIIFTRLLISIPFLFSFALLTGRMMKFRKGDYKWFLVMALFEPFIYFFGESFGLSMVSSTVAAIIVSTIPLFVPVAAYFMLKEKLSVTNIIGLIISFAGVILVVMGSEGRLAGNIKGIMLMFLAVFGAVGYTIIAKRLLDHYNGIFITAWQSTLGFIYITPIFLLYEFPKIDFGAVLPSSIWALVYLGVFGSGICFILFAVGIRELGASKANVFANLVPVVAAITSFLVLKEQMPALKIFGIIVVLGGLLLSQITNMRKRMNSIKWRKWISMPRV
ncbi:MAG: DMT family transporter [Bacteroidales bacterium]|nr:DMT family transporter [Bacteroidales bacterium]